MRTDSPIKYINISLNENLEISRCIKELDNFLNESKAPLPSISSDNILLSQTKTSHHFIVSINSEVQQLDEEIIRWNSPEQNLQLVIYGEANSFPQLNSEHFNRHFLTLFQQITDSPNKKLNQIECIEQSEYNEIITQWNSTDSQYPLEKSIPELVSLQALNTPDAIAIRYKDKSYSYSQLDRLVNQFATYLLDNNVNTSDVVAIYLKRGPLWPIGMLAIWKIGATFLPLESNLPIERLKYIIKDSGCKLVITEDALKTRLTSVRIKTILTDFEQLNILEPNTCPAKALPQDLAYIIYTSGTTGQPKGVKVAHKGLTNLAFCQFERMEFAPHQRILQAVSFNFDASLHDITFAFLSGSILCIADDNERLPGASMVNFLKKEKINFITLPPSALETLPFDNLPDLHTILAVGEVCSSNLVKRWAGKIRFFNGYGPTETTVGALIGECFPNEDKPTIGTALANVKVYILDDRLKPLPVGAIGEIYVGGVGVAKGYLNQPKRTAKSFILNPFLDDGSYLYKTGDKARFLQDGRVDFIGRIDEQVKIDGRRIEIEEIESRCKTDENVKMASVVIEEVNGKKLLRAFLVLSELNDYSNLHQVISTLKTDLSQHLPTYMLPNQFFVLFDLPTSINGKLDRNSLKSMQDQSHKVNLELKPLLKAEKLLTIFQDINDGIYIPICYYKSLTKRTAIPFNSLYDMQLANSHLTPLACVQLGDFDPTVHANLPLPTQFQKKWQNLKEIPSSDTQKLLAETWSKYLPTDNIYLQDEFVELGGESITAACVIADIKKATDIELTGADLFSGNFGYCAAKLENRLTGAPIELQINQVKSIPKPVSAFYFNSKNPMYGVYHPAEYSKVDEHAVLLCPPISNDYQRTRVLFQQTASKLSLAGYPTLRFDYRGMGDSYGKADEMNIDRCKSDILCAINELVARSKCKTVSIIGLRFSASILTSLTLPKTVQQLILIDPITHGVDFLRQQKELHTKLLNNSNYFQWKRKNIIKSDRVQLLGQTVSSLFKNQIKDINLNLNIHTGKVKIHLLLSKNSKDIQLPNDHQFIDKTRLNENFIWCNQDKLVSAILAPSLPSKIIKCLQDISYE